MLPQFGKINDSNKGEAIQFISGLVLEGSSVRQQMLEQADSCAAIYEYGSDSTTDTALVNDAQNAVIASTDIQTKEPPEPTITAVEHTDGGDWYWNGPEGVIGPQYGKVAGGNQLPLPEQLVELLRSMGKDRHLVQINDEEVCKFATTLFKIPWKTSQVPKFLRRNLLQNNVKGWQWVWYRYDKWNRQHRLQNLSSRQVYVDTGVEDVKDAAYAVIDIVLAHDEALKLFPELSEAISKDGTSITGTPTPFDNGDWGKNDGKYYYRPVVPMRICWLRDQAIPMTEEEAIAEGLVRRVEAPVEPSVVIDEFGMQQVVNHPPVIQLLDPNGNAITPDDSAWPARFGIREIIQIGTDIVADGECRDWDIPLAVNQNLPVLGTLFGYGEPYRIKGLQGAKNRAINQMVDYGDYYRHMPAVISQSMKTAMGDVNCVEPGTMIILPDNVFREWVAASSKIFMDLPQLPPAASQFLPALSNELDKQSQHSPVLQGYAPGANVSGRAIEQLQYASSSNISYKAKTTSDMLYRLCRLMLDALVTNLTVEQVCRMVQKYSPTVTGFLMERLKKGHFDIEIEISAGAGAAETVKREQSAQDLKDGLLSPQSASEGRNIDYYREQDRMEANARRQAAAMASMAPQQPMTAGGATQQPNPPAQEPMQ
jgi:hypothetical protein